MGATHQPHSQAYARWSHQARRVHDLGYGGGSADLGYWWQIAWTDLDPEIVTRINNGKDGITPALFINELELAAAVVNYFAAATVIANRKSSFPWQPKVACSGDNTSANSWYKRFSTTNPQARRLTKILARGQKLTGLDMDITHVAGVDNCFTASQTPSAAGIQKTPYSHS